MNVLLVRVLACVFLLTVPVQGFAFGLRPRTTTYYYPVPVATYRIAYYEVPVYVAPPICPPLAQPAPRIHANPWPAPSSPTPVRPRTNEPPPATGAGVTESRSFYDAYGVVPRVRETVNQDTCSVTFWNLSTQDVTLKIAGQAHLLARGKSMKFDQPRDFVWQVDQREAQRERVPANEPALEIVIRR